jgi:hypothetical protein
MVRGAVIVGGVVVGVVVAFVAVLVVAMRTKSPVLLGAMRRFNRRVTNRLQRSAGEAGASASLIRHRGRSSGRAYETPIVPFATDDRGFLVSLPYGSGTDWVRNVLAHGSAVLVTDGHTYPVDRPEVVATDLVGDLFPPSERRTHRLFGVDQCLRLRRADADADADAEADADGTATPGADPD